MLLSAPTCNCRPAHAAAHRCDREGCPAAPHPVPARGSGSFRGCHPVPDAGSGCRRPVASSPTPRWPGPDQGAGACAAGNVEYAVPHPAPFPTRCTWRDGSRMHPPGPVGKEWCPRWF
ncbi:hypothetical protein G6F59_017785 [Rhizopus arrhizus]|nr:hypothetical protein G6F59_017785 [Rhizopus arrhizus]